MIQVNLLPDIKLEFIKARRNKRMVVFSAVGVGGACLALMIIAFVTVNVFQKKHMNDLNADIKKYSKTLEETPNLNKILTVQNQLNNLSTLHEQKPAATRLYGFIGNITPAEVTIDRLRADFVNAKLTIAGAADSLSTVNKYVDTIKFTDYKNGDNIVGRAFPQVVLTSFSRTDTGATYQIDLKYTPEIFDGKVQASLVVPNIITTRSEIEKPSALFQPSQTQGGN